MDLGLAIFTLGIIFCAIISPGFRVLVIACCVLFVLVVAQGMHTSTMRYEAAHPQNAGRLDLRAPSANTPCVKSKYSTSDTVC